MSIPIHNLPLVQNWDCHGCGDCCRIEAVITDEEKRRIEGLDFADDPEVGRQDWFASAGRGSKHWKLTHQPNGDCVFLTKENRCRIQERFGVDAKPFVCRLFPFVLVPAGNHWRVGMRFSCPSAAENKGRSTAEAEKDLERLSRLLERHVGKTAGDASPPLLQVGTALAWPEIRRVVQVLTDVVQDRRYRLERRLRICLALSRICSRTSYDKLQGDRLTKYLNAVRNAMDAEVPKEAADLPPPDRMLGGLLFRSLLAVYARRERDAFRAPGVLGRLSRVLDGRRFVGGRGAVPRVNEFLPKITFEEIETFSGPLPEIEETLERYYLVKLDSLQFCGPPNFNLPLLPGLESLILTLPMILWLRRAFTGLSPLEATQRAIGLVDDHFGGNPVLGFRHIRFLQTTMAQRGELDKLVAWYSR